MKIKLNTDTILQGNQGINFTIPYENYLNNLNKLKALVHHHRQEYLTFLQVNAPDQEGNVHCEQFDCVFSPAEYEIISI